VPRCLVGVASCTASPSIAGERCRESALLTRTIHTIPYHTYHTYLLTFLNLSHLQCTCPRSQVRSGAAQRLPGARVIRQRRLRGEESAASGGAWRYRVGGRVADRRGRGMVGSGSFFGRIVRVCDVGRDFGARTRRYACVCVRSRLASQNLFFHPLTEDRCCIPPKKTECTRHQRHCEAVASAVPTLPPAGSPLRSSQRSPAPARLVP